MRDAGALFPARGGGAALPARANQSQVRRTDGAVFWARSSAVGSGAEVGLGMTTYELVDLEATAE